MGDSNIQTTMRYINRTRKDDAVEAAEVLNKRQDEG